MQPYSNMAFSEAISGSSSAEKHNWLLCPLWVNRFNEEPVPRPQTLHLIASSVPIPLPRANAYGGSEWSFQFC